MNQASQRQPRSRLGLAAVATLALGPAAFAEPVISDPVSIPIAPTFTGTSFNILTGLTGSNPPQDDVADVIFFKLSGEWRLANLDWFEGGGLIGNAAGDRAKVLQPGDIVEITPEQPLLPGGGIRTFGDFDDVEGAYIGAYFENESTGNLHYGWVEVTLPGSGPGVITRYAFESVPDTPIAIPGSLGTPYCAAAPNSTGSTSTVSAFGSPLVAANDVTLSASALPPNRFGIFLVSRTQDFDAGAGGTSDGNLCLGGSIGRYSEPGQILFTGAAGEFELAIDLTQVPAGSAIQSIAPGETWNFQAWHRDSSGLGSNFSRGLEITFR